MCTGSAYLFISLYIAFSTISVCAQNFVPNPSFECGVDNCSPTIIPSYFSQYACEWSSPTGGTPDIFSTQIADPYCYSSVPYRGTSMFLHSGSQMPRTGNRFAGFFTYYNNRSADDYREYLQVKLKTPLIENEEYCAELYTTGGEASLYYSNNIGMAFHLQPTMVNEWYGGPLNIIPQILETAIIADTTSWVKISGTFKASSAAQYLTIGNFFDDDQTQFLYHGPHNDNYYAYAFYFVDDISVEKMPYDRFFVTGETTICKGESTVIKAYAGVEQVIWTTLEDTLTVLNTERSYSIKPSQTTSYRVKSKGCNKSVTDTITIKVNPIPDVYLGKDTTICEKSELILVAGSEGNNSYQWQDLSSSNHFKVTSAGKYSVNVKNLYNCLSFDEIVVSSKESPTVNIGRDTLVCGNIFPLDAGNEGSQYKWSTGSTSRKIAVDRSGEYSVEVKNVCGMDHDTITIASVNDAIVTNIVTPNGDGKNEKMVIISSTGKVAGELAIYDRWGNILFKEKQYSGNWPTSDQISTGVYYYSFVLPGCPLLLGSVTVLEGQK